MQQGREREKASERGLEERQKQTTTHIQAKQPVLRGEPHRHDKANGV